MLNCWQNIMGFTAGNGRLGAVWHRIDDSDTCCHAVTFRGPFPPLRSVRGEITSPCNCS